MKYKVALFIGRFQPFHNGHLYSLKKCLEIANSVIVGIGSSQTSGNQDNPWDYETRKEMVESVLRGVSSQVVAIPDVFNDEKWGAQILSLIKEQGCKASEVVGVGNNDWTNRIFRSIGVEVYETGLYKRDELEGIKIRALIKSRDNSWKRRVPETVVKYLEMEEIIGWLKKIYGDKPAVVAVSGGVDSALVLTLLVKALGKDKVTPVCLPYKKQDMTDAKLIIEWNGLSHKMVEINIGEHVDSLADTMGAEQGSVRKGNIMARVRMICVFDIAKQNGALVCGTENKSEHYLGYFTRFGDAASDVEPISRLYKTEVWEMAKELGLPEVFYTKAPSAGLWQGQTDEGEMGFSYEVADKVLQGQTEGIDPKIVAKVQQMVEQNAFKREVPYEME